MSTPIKPLADRVVATRVEAAEKTASGLYLPDNAKEKPVMAEVKAIGPDVKSIKKGDRILYKEYSTTEIKIDGIEMRGQDISYKVLLYTGVNDVLRKDQLRLDQADIEQKGMVISKTLQEIAGTIHSMEAEEQPRLLAELALKFNSA